MFAFDIIERTALMGTETSFLLFVVLHVEEPYSSQQNSAQLDCFLVSVSTNATAAGGGDGVTVASIGSFMQHKTLAECGSVCSIIGCIHWSHLQMRFVCL